MTTVTNERPMPNETSSVGHTELNYESTKRGRQIEIYQPKSPEQHRDKETTETLCNGRNAKTYQVTKER